MCNILINNIHIYIYINGTPLVSRFCLISGILSGNFAFVWPNVGVCHNSTIQNSGPKIAGRRSM